MKRICTIAQVAFVLLWVLAACKPTPDIHEPVAIDPSAVEEFSNEFFPEQIEKLHIPGLVFLFVQNGEVIFAKGYGYANLEEGVPMDADTTIVRIGSISKTFVATAVMQLVEQGKLDLDTDINRYLTTFQLEAAFSKPVTSSALLTHTAGLEDPPYVSNVDPYQVQPLGEYLAQALAGRQLRVDPPGKTFRYSSHGYALAAYIVEEVSGLPFDQYVNENILAPLGMKDSQYLLAPPLPEHLATGYFYDKGLQVPQPIDYDNDYPGGSIVSTAADMSRFMLAHLQEGCYRGVCILQPSSVAKMHQKQAETPYEGQNVAFGFVDSYKNGVHLIGHSGAIRGFGAIMDLSPEQEMGYFIGFNEECYMTSACEIIATFRQQFLDRFFQ